MPQGALWFGFRTMAKEDAPSGLLLEESSFATLFPQYREQYLKLLAQMRPIWGHLVVAQKWGARKNRTRAIGKVY